MTEWRKASFSQPHGQCIELGGTLDQIRDSKNPVPILAVDLTALLEAVKADRFRL
ncbi:MAG TPA: DUF397 domain-containing protein [Pseudonocardiaceae bacterium]|jgi:hypothetical protein|nr:DUF397 domain-containing protein [Pseudonocardiaceae bacterium]